MGGDAARRKNWVEPGTGRSLNGVVGTDAVSLEGGSAHFDNRNVGTGKDVTLTGASLAGTDSGNYTLTSVGVEKAAITPMTVTGSFTAGNKVYDGNVTATIATRFLSGEVSGDSVSLSGGTATFDNKNVGTGKNVNATGFSLSGIHAGNYQLAAGPWTATADITARPITVTADPKSKVYGSADPDLTSKVTSGNLVSGDSFTGNPTRDMGESVAGSPYAIKKGTLSAGSNYDLTYVGANFTITARPISVKADNKSKIFGAADPPLTYQVTSGSLATGDSFSGSLTRDPGENVGTYTIRQGTVTAGSNYTLSFSTATLSILYGWNGFLQPINDTAHQTGVNESKFKLGQTIPAKFVLKNAAGGVVQQAINPTFSRSGNLGTCDSTTVLETINEVITPDAGVTYNWDGSRYHYNWSTKGLTAGEYRIYANLADGTKQYVDICLTR